MTCRKHKQIQKIFNDSNEIVKFRDKSIFNGVFAQFLKRESLDLSQCNESQFVEFCNRNEEIFIKDKFGFCGKNIQVIRTSDIDKAELFRKLTVGNENNYLVESVLKQNSEIAAFHPWSINTIRIVTLYDKTSDLVSIMCARLRLGNNQNRVDNFHYDGLCAPIDEKTGVIYGVAYDRNGKEYIFHPETGLQIVGFKIPYWKECIEFVHSLATVVPTVGYVGWDIVVQDNGEFALIEGNDNADHDIQQIGRKGIWHKYLECIE